MTTADFIAMLQKEDPSGKAHLRLGDGVPISCELKEGYWDGPFTYIDEDGKFVTSIKGDKVDIRCKSAVDYIWDDFCGLSFITDYNTLFEELKTKFRFEFEGYHPTQAQERIDRFYSWLKTEFDKWAEYKVASDER